MFTQQDSYLFSPELEMNKSSVHSDCLISSGDPDYPNRLAVIMSTSDFIWDFTPAFIGTEGTDQQVECGQSTFTTDACAIRVEHLNLNIKPFFQMCKVKMWNSTKADPFAFTLCE